MYKLRFLLVLATFISLLQVSAQTLRAYTGPYPYIWKARPYSNDGTKLLGPDIDAEYQYYIDDDTDERVFHGKFHGSKSLTLKNKEGKPFISSIEIQGDFKNDTQDGRWIYEYHYAATTIKCVLNFKNGLYNGIQTMEVSHNGKYLKVEENYLNGLRSGEQKFESSYGDNGVMYFTEHGLPEGNWEIVRGNETHRVSFDDNSHVLKARTIDNRTGDVQQWNDRAGDPGYILRAIRCFDVQAIPSIEMSNAMMGKTSSASPIFGIYPMRKSKGVTDRSDLASTDDDKLKETDKVYTIVDEEPQFPGGKDALNDWLYENVAVPADWKYYEKIKVTVFFDKEGNVGYISAPGARKEIKDQLVNSLLKNTMPKWLPAKIKGEPVKAKITFVWRLPNKPKK